VLVASGHDRHDHARAYRSVRQPPSTWDAIPEVRVAMGGSDGARPAPLTRRALARLTDAFLVEFLLTAIIAYTITEVLGAEPSADALVATVVLIGSLRLLYYAGLEAAQGATLGKRMLRLQVRGPIGAAPPTFGAAIRRNAWVLLALVPGWLGWVLWVGVPLSIAAAIQADGAGRGWHDRLGGGTRVVVLPG